jgi:hypothetical protein
VHSLERRAAAAAAAAAASPSPLAAAVLARLDDEALGPEDDVSPDDILDVTTRVRRDAAERAAGLDMDSVLKAAAINPNKESLEPQTDAAEPFRKGLGTVDALLWRSAARSSSSPASGANALFRLSLDLVFFFFFFLISSAFCFPLALTAQQLKALGSAAAARPGFSHPRVAAGLTKAAIYVVVDGGKIHVRSVLATLCGRPRTSKDRVLRVQDQAVAIAQQDEGADEPAQDECEYR